MKKTWVNPTKQPPKEETMNTPGDFKAFTELMKKIVKKPSSRDPAAS
jgi:hypothetical protein